MGSMLIKAFEGFVAIAVYAVLVVVLDEVFDLFLGDLSGLTRLSASLIIPAIGLAIIWDIVMNKDERRF